MPMKCYRCGSELGRQDICLKCGAPLNTYRLIVRRANSLYNSGLEKARVRDLSGAIEALQLCLEYDKHHIQARNLLGLIYHEIGEDAEAMAEWVISEEYQPEDNLATSFIKKMMDSNQIERCNTAVRKYNHSLTLAKGADHSYDLSLLQLQKVIRINPKFIRAYQLLALIYIHNEEYGKAYKAVRTALEINRSDVTCLRYRKELASFLGRKSKSAAKREEILKKANESKGVVVPTYRESSGLFQAVLHVFGGIFLGLLVCRFLVIPGIRQQIQRDTNEKIMSYGDQLSGKDAQIQSLESQIAQLEEEQESANTQLESYTGQNGVVDAYETMLQVLENYYNGDYLTAVDLFGQLDESTVDGEVYQEIYQRLNEEFSAGSRDELYTRGYQAYQSNDYETAMQYFLQCLEIDPDYVDAMYWLGLCYHNTGDKATADTYYTRVIEEYPETSYAQSARELRGY